MRLTSASHHLSLVASTVFSASARQREASSSWPIFAYAFVRQDKKNGTNSVAPVDRDAAIPEVIILTASEALPVKAKSQPCRNIASAFQSKAAFSSASAKSSSRTAFAAA